MAPDQDLQLSPLAVCEGDLSFPRFSGYPYLSVHVLQRRMSVHQYGNGVPAAVDDKVGHAVRYGLPTMFDRTLSAT